MGAVRAATAIAPRAAPIGAAVLVVAVLVATSGTLRSQWREVSARAASAAAFDGVIARAGGKAALARCARFRTSPSARSLVAWRLDLPMRDLDARAAPPAVAIQANWFYGRGFEPAVDSRFRSLIKTPYWAIATACGPAPQKGRLATDPRVGRR